MDHPPPLAQQSVPAGPMAATPEPHRQLLSAGETETRREERHCNQFAQSSQALLQHSE
jgi:hypothetical protein